MQFALKYKRLLVHIDDQGGGNFCKYTLRHLLSIVK